MATTVKTASISLKLTQTMGLDKKNQIGQFIVVPPIHLHLGLTEQQSLISKIVRPGLPSNPIVFVNLVQIDAFLRVAAL